jgi:hypothetical protein
MKRIFLLIVFFHLLLCFLSGQTVRKPLSAGFRVHSGLSLPVYKALDYIITDDVYAIDISLERRASGDNFQDELWNFPKSGIGYSVWSLGNDEVLGKAHTLYASISIPFSARQKRVSPGIRAAAGAAYLSRKFDVVDNHLNRAIGSDFNIYMNLSAECLINLNKSVDLIVDAGLTHFSNGKTRSPNYGLNAAAVSAGIYYNFHPAAAQIISDPGSPEVHQVPKKYFHSIGISAGRKVYDNLAGNKYLSSTFSYSLERYTSHSGKAGLGADLFYDGSIDAGLSEKGRPDNSLTDLVRFGIHASYTLQYRKMSGGLQLGYYLYSKYTVLTNLYTRIILQYRVASRINAGASIRSHFGKADALEYGITYTW